MGSPEQSSLSFTQSLKLFITQMHDCGFGLIADFNKHLKVTLLLNSNNTASLDQTSGAQ